jgi:DNA-3-methyladenine glycosylase I
VRNRLKIEAAIKNARAVPALWEAFGSFASFIWRNDDHTPRQNAWTFPAEIPARTEVSERN